MRAFLVLGPESSGTRLMTQLLIAAGCQGDGGDKQRWDTVAPEGELVVWRRSLPHGGQWPDVQECVERLRSYRYTVRALVMSRDWYATQMSQVGAGHVAEVFLAHQHIRKAYRLIFGALTRVDVDYEIVNYETLVRPGTAAVDRLLDRLNLDPGSPLIIYDGNAKYYDVVRA